MFHHEKETIVSLKPRTEIMQQQIQSLVSKLISGSEYIDRAHVIYAFSIGQRTGKHLQMLGNMWHTVDVLLQPKCCIGSPPNNMTTMLYFNHIILYVYYCD